MPQQSEKFKMAFSSHRNGQLTRACDLYKEILKTEPDNHEVWDLLGVLYCQVGKFCESEECIKKAIELNPLIYYYENLARLYFEKKDFCKAVDCYSDIISGGGDSYENRFNLAMSYKNLNDYDKAVEFYHKAIEFKPDSQETYFNLAAVYTAKNDLQKAIECYKKSIELKPDDWEADYFLSLVYMQSKDYKNGLKSFESRLCRQSAIMSQFKTYPNLMKEKKLWQGEDLSGKTLYTYYEAGFGDILMFYRFMPELVSMCKKVIFKPQKELVPLLKENSYGAEIMELFRPEGELDFDYHIPFLSIPYVMGKFGEDMFIHHDDGYLKANFDKVKVFKSKFFNNEKFKIGIKWQGNIFYEKNRVLKVEDFFPLFDIPNTQFYSCQTFDGSEEFEKISDKYDVINLAPHFNDFSDTAAAVENLDLIICNDTSLAHLAGAMGKLCYVILPYIYNWRWHTDLTKCDWYDSVKLFRQKTPQSWNGVFSSVKNELEKLLN